MNKQNEREMNEFDLLTQRLMQAIECNEKLRELHKLNSYFYIGQDDVVERLRDNIHFINDLVDDIDRDLHRRDKIIKHNLANDE